VIEVGDSHWQWHVDQIVRIHRDGIKTADALEAALAPRRAAFIGTGQFQGTAETWRAAVDEARFRSRR
jgi:hypothetical protein